MVSQRFISNICSSGESYVGAEGRTGLGGHCPSERFTPAEYAGSPIPILERMQEEDCHESRWTQAELCALSQPERVILSQIRQK